MADSTLTAIRKKIRRITRSNSVTNLSDSEIDEYVNTFLQFDLPKHLKLYSLTDNFVFYTEPDVDTYGSSVVDPNIYINLRNIWLESAITVFCAYLLFAMF